MKFGIRECADIVLKAKSNVKIGSHTFVAGEPVIYFDTAKTSSLESSTTTVYATGGRGNNNLIAWEGEKTMTFTMEDALISPKGLAILTGADLIQADTSKTVTAHTTENLVATGTSSITITTTETPVASADIYVMLLDSNGEMANVPVKIASTSVSSNTITLPTGIFKANDVVMVDYYVAHTADAIQIDITPDQFAGYYYLEASTLFRREADGKDLPAEFIIPKVKIQSNFSFALASSGEPSTFSFTMDALPDYSKFDKTKKILCSIQVLGADDNYDLLTADEETTVTYQRYKEYTDIDSAYIRTSADDAYETSGTKEYPTD